MSLTEETICSSAERAVFFFFLSEFGSLNTFLPDCQKDYFVFVMFFLSYFHRDTFVGLRCFEQTRLMFID